jgi:sulfoxide reductase heme-binding subunit YedZ
MPRRAWLKAAVFVLCLTPAGYLGWRFYEQDLTANPLEYITHFTGDWALRLICATLAITPLRRLLRAPGLIRFRRMVGLFAFFYGSLHFLTYLWLDRLFDFRDLAKDIAKRPFITAGFACFVLMLPLAITSTAGWIRRMGGRRWQMLHRLIYVAAIAAVVHYYWLVKSDIRLPLLYGGIVGVLLLYRAAAWLRTAVGHAQAESRGTAQG